MYLTVKINHCYFPYVSLPSFKNSPHMTSIASSVCPTPTGSGYHFAMKPPFADANAPTNSLHAARILAGSADGMTDCMSTGQKNVARPPNFSPSIFKPMFVCWSN